MPRIRGAMLDELRTMDWVPRLVRSKATRLEESRKELEAHLGRPPRPDEMAEKLGVSLQEYDKMAGDATAVSLVSLNKKWYETDSYKDVREIDILEDKKAEDPTNRLQNRDLMRLVTRGLNRNERLIVILYYYEEMTMKEIGATLNLSESRVSQMHSSIVARLQAHLGDLAIGDRDVNLSLKRALDLFEILSDIDLPQSSTAADDAVYGQCIKEFIREDAASDALRQMIDPLYVVPTEQFTLSVAHLRTSFKNEIRKAGAFQNVAGEQTFTGTQFDDRKVLEHPSPFFKLRG